MRHSDLSNIGEDSFRFVDYVIVFFVTVWRLTMS
jgi:hypothetical protein